MAYVYRGTKHDVIEPLNPIPERPQRSKARARTPVFYPAKCGTAAGAVQHRRFKTPACEPCAEARRDYDRDWRDRRRAGFRRPAPGFNPDKCGTTAGYKQHSKYGVELCDPCRKAKSDYVAAAKATKPKPPPKPRKRPKPPIPCGSYAAHRRHKRAGEPIDDACREAYNAHERERRPATRQLRPCGTASAYRRHKERGEPICDLCQHVGTAQPNQETKAA